MIFGSRSAAKPPKSAGTIPAAQGVTRTFAWDAHIQKVMEQFQPKRGLGDGHNPCAGWEEGHSSIPGSETCSHLPLKAAGADPKVRLCHPQLDTSGPTDECGDLILPTSKKEELGILAHSLGSSVEPQAWIRQDTRGESQIWGITPRAGRGKRGWESGAERGHITKGQGSAAGGSRGRGGAMAEPAPVLLPRSHFSP